MAAVRWWSRAGLGAMIRYVPSLIPRTMAAGSLRRLPHPSASVGAIAVLRFASAEGHMLVAAQL